MSDRSSIGGYKYIMSMCTSSGAQRCGPESNSAPGPTHSKVGMMSNLSTGAFHYETLNSDTKSVAGASSSTSRLEDHRQVQCSCGPFLGSRAKQLGGRNRSNVRSKLRGGGVHDTSAAGFLFSLWASCGRLRESIRTTNLNVYDLFVGSQMMFLMTASPIPRTKAKAASNGTSSSRRLGTLPVTSFTRSSSTPGQKLPDMRVKSSKAFPVGRGCDSNADRRLLSSRRSI